MCNMVTHGVKCGDVTLLGTKSLCESCEKAALKVYPQGWRRTPGDLCKHGNYVGNAYGPDYMCGRCENGE